jgi:hypothetical protein
MLGVVLNLIARALAANYRTVLKGRENAKDSLT